MHYHFQLVAQGQRIEDLSVSVLQHHKRLLGPSSLQLDDSHTPAKNGGAAISYQGRKKAHSTTKLLLTDNNSQPLASATPQTVNYHDLFHIE